LKIPFNAVAVTAEFAVASFPGASSEAESHGDRVGRQGDVPLEGEFTYGAAISDGQKGA